MKGLRKAATLILGLLLIALGHAIESPSALADSGSMGDANWVITRDVHVPSNLKWPAPVSAEAARIQMDGAVRAENLLARFKRQGASLVEITENSPSVAASRIASTYPELGAYTKSLHLRAYGAWSTYEGQTSYTPEFEARADFALINFSGNKCRLMFDFWNPGTWFLQECAAKVATTEELLRFQMIVALSKQKPLDGLYFDQVSTLSFLGGKRLPYKVLNGFIDCPGLEEWGVAPRRFALHQDGFGEIPGYRVVIGPANKWKFTITYLGRTLQEVASAMSVRTVGGVRVIQVNLWDVR